MSSKQVSTAGGHRRTIELCPTKLSMETSGYPAWPAGRTCSVNQNRLLLYQKARLVRLQVVHECSEKYLLLTHRFAVFTHAWTSAFSSHIEASFYHTSVSSLVDFRKPLCGTAPSVIPIKRGNNANSCRCAFLTLLFVFLSPCFLSLLTGADMSNFVFRVESFGNVVKGSKIQRFWLTKSSITDALAMSADITESYSNSIIRDSQIHGTDNLTWYWLATDQQYSHRIYLLVYLFISLRLTLICRNWLWTTFMTCYDDRLWAQKVLKHNTSAINLCSSFHLSY